jgi:cob(I)alamin adenosyltransferase
MTPEMSNRYKLMDIKDDLTCIGRRLSHPKQAATVRSIKEAIAHVEAAIEEIKKGPSR